MKIPFSKRLFAVTTIIHFSLTVLVAIGALGSVLGASPTHNPSRDVTAAEVFFWVWQTGPSLLYHGWGLKMAFLLSILWSFLVGIAAGYFGPRFLEKEKDA
ncbi:hypothetical protein Ga0100231_008055 [Opitutaceae bacterium TAV4]|nr:hypothetical protein Ga0100231_008055 [Opitutaceae bacterium TAV4]RRJ98408.1 hypothetical protein Ga0100230_008355 [Opitutaceae bacterium TAV3]